MNILKEYKDIFSKEKSDGSDKHDDKIATESDSLAALKVRPPCYQATRRSCGGTVSLRT